MFQIVVVVNFSTSVTLLDKYTEGKYTVYIYDIREKQPVIPIELPKTYMEDGDFHVEMKGSGLKGIFQCGYNIIILSKAT